MELPNIIRSQREILTSSGYTDKDMQYKGLSARFMKSLVDALEKALLTSLWVKGKKEFQLSLSGLLGRERDLVDYKFHYSFDPSDTTLSIERITARLGDTRLDFLLRKEDPLPGSREIYAALLKERNEHPVQENKETNNWKNRL